MLKEKQRIFCVLRLGFEADRLPQVSECRATVSRKVLDVGHRRWHLDAPVIGLVGRCRHGACLLLSSFWCGVLDQCLEQGFLLEDPTPSLSTPSARSFPLDQYMVQYFYDIVKGFY